MLYIYNNIHQQLPIQPGICTAMQQEYQMSKHSYRSRVDSLDWTQVDMRVPAIPHHHVYTFMPQPDEIKYYRRLLYYLYISGQQDKQDKQEHVTEVGQQQEQHTQYTQQRQYKLYTQQQQTRILSLTAYMLCINLNNYYAMMLRNQTRNHMLNRILNNNTSTNNNGISQYERIVKQELYFINCLLNKNPKEYQLWNSKKDIITNILTHIKEIQENRNKEDKEEKEENEVDKDKGDKDDKKKSSIDNTIENIHESIRKQQDNFIFYLMTNDDEKNYHAWDYKTWIARHFNKIEQAILDTNPMLFITATAAQGNGNTTSTNTSNDSVGDNGIAYDTLWKDCYSCWSYRFNLILDLPTHTRAKYIRQDTDTVLAYVLKNPQSQCAWNYLTGLLELGIYNTQGNKDEGGDGYTYAQQKQKILKLIHSICSTVKQQNRYAWALLLQLSGDAETRKEALARLRAIDGIRAIYYDYLETNNYV